MARSRPLLLQVVNEVTHFFGTKPCIDPSFELLQLIFFFPDLVRKYELLLNPLLASDFIPLTLLFADFHIPAFAHDRANSFGNRFFQLLFLPIAQSSTCTILQSDFRSSSSVVRCRIRPRRIRISSLPGLYRREH